MRRVLITGASRGIGRAIAERLAALGGELVLHGRDRRALAVTCRLVEKAGAQATEAVGDLATEDGVQAVVAAAGDAPLDALIHNAGMAVVKPVGEVTLEEWQTSLAVNVTAPFLLTQRLLPMIVAASGSVVHVLSTAAHRGFPGWSAYCAA
jgi:benzil reductase ((S)-benzoin forming)